MDLKAAASLMNVEPKSSRHSRPGSSSHSRSSVRLPPSSGSSPGAKSGSEDAPAPREGKKKRTRKRSVRGLHYWKHHRRLSPTASAAASPSKTKPPMTTSVSTMSAPATVQTSQSPEKAESAGKGTPTGGGLSSAASTMSSFLQTQRVRLQRRPWPSSQRVLAVLALFVGVASALAVVYYFYRSAPSGTLQSQRALTSRVCVTAACREHASFFRRNLDTRGDPCVDLDAYVCSLWAPSSALASDLAGQMALAWTLRATESLTRDATSEALDAGGALGAQRKFVSAFLRKCIAQKDDDPDRLQSVRAFAAGLGIPWPYKRVPRTHPFEVLTRLDMLWGLDLWCQTAVLKSRRQKPIPPMLVIRRTDMASVWLELVDALDNNQGRMAYYEDIHSLYGVPVPNATTVARHLKTEREVLTALATVVNETSREAVDTTVDRLEPVFSNLGGIPLAKFILSFFNASGIHERSRVYFDSRRFVVAVDELLGKFGKDQLMEHIAWWFAQLCAVLASSKARLLIGGNEVESGTLKKARCFDVAAAWFGPMLYGSVAYVATADEKHAVDDFLQGLLRVVQRTVTAISWTDETTRRAMIRRLREMDVVNLQKSEAISTRLATSHAALSEAWSNSTQDFIDVLITTTMKRISMGGESWRFYVDGRWLAKPYHGLLYCYLSNTLLVMHAATTGPLFYADYSGGGVLRAASFGGLATAFLEAALRTFDRRGIRIDEGEARPWMSPRAERQLYRRFRCSNVIGENMLQVASLRIAWEAYKNASSGGDSSSGEALDILDSYGNTRRYTSDQLFFLTYCRRFCSTGTSCNPAVRSLPDFGSVFGCSKGRPEEDDLSQCRFLT